MSDIDFINGIAGSVYANSVTYVSLSHLSTRDFSVIWPNAFALFVFG
jgi:hypothetical protein